ncbi:MAG: pilus assembly protein TadG-related protein [bacterium]
MSKFVKGKKGQVLVISIAVIFIIFIFIITSVEIGNLMYEKTHIQNIADSGALEGGLWYARGMNMLALSNKVLVVTGVAAVIATLLGDPNSGKNAIELVQKAQDLMAGTGEMDKTGIKTMPLFGAMAVILNGKDNKAYSIPISNLADIKTGKGLPSFNVRRRYVDNMFEQGKEDKYYYKKKSTNEKIYVDKNNVQIDLRINNKSKVMTKNDPIHGNKFLSKEKGKANNQGTIPLDIVESSNEHSVLVISYKNSEQLNQISGFKFLTNVKGDEIRPAFLMSYSFVRITGGTLDILAMDGANYEPKIEHIELPKIESTDDIIDSLGQVTEQTQTNTNSDKINNNILNVINILNNDLVLH